GNEVTIAVNPKDPRNIVGGAKDYYPMDAGQCVWDGIYVTHDGGATEYEDRNFDGSPWRLLNDPASFRPNYASSYWCTTDPVAYFDVHGTFYYLLMAYQTDPVTGSKLGEDQLPMGALNDWAFNRATQIVAISSDGGDSFHTFTPVLEGSFPVSFHDKGWIAAGPDGVIHVMWLAVLLPGNLYFRSTDGGKTFSDPEVLATTVGNSGQGSFVDVGTGSQVYAMWTSDSVYMRRSLDSGATWDAERPLFQVNDAQHPGLSPRDRVTGFPALATDRNPDSPLADALYVIWHDACNDEAWRSGCDSGASGVYVRASFDQGETWGDPVRVSGGDTRWRMLPALSVSPGGVLDASWMEHTDERIPAGDGVAERARMRQMYSYSLDGGATWSEPVDIRDAGDGGWDPAVCRHQNGMVFLGDYNDIDSSWQAAHPVWPDARHGVCDVFTATMQRPMFAQGWDAAKREAAEQWIRGHPLT
ncbi:MAG TPA: sialidase family protein, partial [Candidatus Thermoplasmatota archaeon]|nr:sialidase family protein [Candidatus Thermoplasmatota archaeon]